MAHVLIKILLLVKYAMDQVLHINKETITNHNLFYLEWEQYNRKAFW